MTCSTAQFAGAMSCYEHVHACSCLLHFKYLYLCNC